MRYVKRLIALFLVLVTLICISMTTKPVSAAETESELKSEQTILADTYYYDRIP